MQRREFITLLGGTAATVAAGGACSATGRTGLPGGVPRDPVPRRQALHLIKAFEETSAKPRLPR